MSGKYKPQARAGGDEHETAAAGGRVAGLATGLWKFWIRVMQRRDKRVGWPQLCTWQAVWPWTSHQPALESNSFSRKWWRNQGPWRLGCLLPLGWVKAKLPSRLSAWLLDQLCQWIWSFSLQSEHGCHYWCSRWVFGPETSGEYQEFYR